MNIKYEIQFTGPASDDLEKIKHYLDGYSSSVFYSFRKEFMHKVNLLENNPKLFEALPMESSIQYRRFFVKNYAVIYDVDEKEQMVIIDRVYHCKEDYLKQNRHYKQGG